MPQTFRSKNNATKAAKGHYGRFVQYVRRTKEGAWKLYRYEKDSVGHNRPPRQEKPMKARKSVKSKNALSKRFVGRPPKHDAEKLRLKRSGESPRFREVKVSPKKDYEEVTRYEMRDGKVEAVEYESFGPVTPEQQKALDERLGKNKPIEVKPDEQFTQKGPQVRVGDRVGTSADKASLTTDISSVKPRKERPFGVPYREHARIEKIRKPYYVEREKKPAPGQTPDVSDLQALARKQQKERERKPKRSNPVKKILDRRHQKKSESAYRAGQMKHETWLREQEKIIREKSE